MRRASLRWAAVLAACLGAMVHGEAAAEEPKAAEPEDENDYGRKGLFDVGGSVAAGWTPDVFDLNLTPSLGWFVLDRLELSVRLSILYTNVKHDDGTRTRTTLGSAVLEPSYHWPIGDTVFVFAGLGIGFAYDGSHPDFEILPRVGLNIEVGRAGVFTPAAQVPVLIGRNQGPANGLIGVVGGVRMEAGFSTTF